MAFSANGGGGYSRRRHSDFAAMAEINVVPLVDVVLVLLIIFMLTAQVMEFGLEIEVPKVKPQRTTADPLPVVSISKTGTSYLNDAPVNINDIGDAVRKKFGAATKAVFIRADKDVRWDTLAQVVAEVSEAKFEVRMVTKPQDIADRKR